MQLDLEAWRGRARLCSSAAHRQPEQAPRGKPDTRSKQAADYCIAHRQPEQASHAKPDIEPNWCSDDRRTHAEPERRADSCADPIAHTKPDINAHDAVSDCTGGHILPDSRSDDRRTHT